MQSNVWITISSEKLHPKKLLFNPLILFIIG